MTATSVLVTERAKSLDELVAEVCLTLQISPTQFEQAKEHYTAVGEWLSDKGSALAAFRPLIYPQGSMAHRTTVRPREREEYDLDLVFQVDAFHGGPMALYDLVRDRLAQHSDYKNRMEPLKRCLRLTYAHEFHLDILPARLDEVRGGTCIEVPDRKLRDWKESNPLGFVAWFDRRCELAPTAKAERALLPLPRPLPEHLAQTLRRIVQLIKRRRDNRFAGSDLAPRSIVLTTLAGEFYQGQESVIDGLEQILAAVDAAATVLYPRRLEVRNPMNPAELFSEAWTNGEAYDAFLSFVRDFRTELATLRQAEGLREIGTLLDHILGDDLGRRAVRAYSERRGRAKEEGALRFGAPGIVVGGAKGRRSAPHTFHHGTTS